jgi:hypothetical protein
VRDGHHLSSGNENEVSDEEEEEEEEEEMMSLMRLTGISRRLVMHDEWLARLMVHGNICQLNLFQSLRGREGIQEAESLGGRDVIIMIS